LTTDEVLAWKQKGYRPQEIYESNIELRQTIECLASGVFSDGDTKLFQPIVDSLIQQDEYMLLADYGAYIEVSERAAAAYSADPEAWTRSSILNTARSGYFSSDRAIRDYCQAIWNVSPVDIE
jgi:starch phosphorylase